jgi:hypothetical protein
MDGWEVGFDSRDEAEAFVRQLKARINAPHAWPVTAVTEPLTRQPPAFNPTQLLCKERWLRTDKDQVACAWSAQP